MTCTSQPPLGWTSARSTLWGSRGSTLRCGSRMTLLQMSVLLYNTLSRRPCAVTTMMYSADSGAWCWCCAALQCAGVQQHRTACVSAKAESLQWSMQTATSIAAPAVTHRRHTIVCVALHMCVHAFIHALRCLMCCSFHSQLYFCSCCCCCCLQCSASGGQWRLCMRPALYPRTTKYQGTCKGRTGACHNTF